MLEVQLCGLTEAEVRVYRFMNAFLASLLAFVIASVLVMTVMAIAGAEVTDDTSSAVIYISSAVSGAAGVLTYKISVKDRA